jgi:hypothetical protein
MASIFSPVGTLIHDTAAALIDKQIPDKLASTINGFVTSGFQVVSDVLGVVRDVTKPTTAP